MILRLIFVARLGKVGIVMKPLGSSGDFHPILFIRGWIENISMTVMIINLILSFHELGPQATIQLI